MSSPRSKAQIVQRLQTERGRLEQNLARLRYDEMLQPGVVGQWSVKDVLAHLADWQARLMPWVAAARRGEPVETPAPGLTWKQLDVVNQGIYQAHRDQTLVEVLEYFHATYRQFMELVEAMPEVEMLAPGRYAFTGRGLIYDWLIAYAEHDRWGKTEIRKWMKAHQSSEIELLPT